MNRIDVIRYARERAAPPRRPSPSIRRAGGPYTDSFVSVGAGVLDRLTEQNLPVSGFNAGSKALDSEAFINARAETYSHLRELFEQGEIDLDPNDEELAAQLCAIKWDVDSGCPYRCVLLIAMAKAPTPPRRDPREFWIEMSIREISTQAHFADLAFSNLDPKAMTGTDAVFSSIHSFLSHCAMVSKMLKGSEAGVPGTIGDVLGIDSESPVHKRRFRNALEHYDRELQKWIQAMPPGANIGTYNVGPKDPLGIPNMIFVSHYDPHSTVFTFVDDDFDLGVLHAEALRVKGVADEWVANHDALKRGANVPARSFSTAP